MVTEKERLIWQKFGKDYLGANMAATLPKSRKNKTAKQNQVFIINLLKEKGWQITLSK